MNNDKKYCEEVARQILHVVCGYDICSLIHADKPDLQDYQHNYGVEVVRDVYKDVEERHVFIEEIWKKDISTVERKKIENFKKNGAKIRTTDDRITSATLSEKRSNAPTHLINTIKGKIDKLNNNHYAQFNHYSLFVFVRTTFLDENFDSYVAWVIEEIQKYKQELNYTHLFLEYHYGICICDMEKGTFARKPIDRDTRELIEKEAQRISLFGTEK